MRDAPSMVQKLLEEEREAVKSALQAVDHHLQLKKQEVQEVQKKFLKDEPIKDPVRAALQMDLRANRHRLAAYTPFYNSPAKQSKPVFLEAIYEEDHDSNPLQSLGNRTEKKIDRIRHSAVPRQATAKSRCSINQKVTSARPRMRSEISALPPIETTWSNVGPSDGCYTGPLNYRWQRVADNYIDSDLRLRSRRKCRGTAYETRLRLGYTDEDDTEDELMTSNCSSAMIVDREMRIPRKRQIHFGPPHSTSYSRWMSQFSGIGGNSQY